MKKNFKTMAAALAVTGTMALTMGMGMTAFAADTRNADSKYTTSKDDLTDTDSINLIKNYIRKEGSQNDSVSPSETFTFTITPYAVWNAGSSTGEPTEAAYVTNNIPLLGNTADENVTIDLSARKTTVNVVGASAGSSDVSTTVSVPDFNSVGDFWYQVVEKDNKTTGVTYATNDEDKKYYIHVQVTNYDDNGTNRLYRTVTLHKTAPDATFSNADYNDATKNITDTNSFYNTSNKVNDIQNTYSAGTVNIKKTVTGNAGDKDKRFKVTVTFTKPEGTLINSDIVYKAVKSANSDEENEYTIAGQYDTTKNDWTPVNSTLGGAKTDAAYSSVDIWIKHGETVTFKNVPYGVTYTVVEQNDGYSADKYENPSYTFDNDSENGDTVINGDTTWLNNKATGEVSDSSDTVTITNKKDVTIDVGVLLSNAPYAAMLALAGTAGVVFVKRRKKDIED